MDKRVKMSINDDNLQHMDGSLLKCVHTFKNPWENRVLAQVVVCPAGKTIQLHQIVKIAYLSVGPLPPQSCLL